jgi:hypothetical protein
MKHGNPSVAQGFTRGAGLPPWPRTIPVAQDCPRGADFSPAIRAEDPGSPGIPAQTRAIVGGPKCPDS